MAVCLWRNIIQKPVDLFSCFFSIYAIFFFFSHKTSRMHLLQSDSANESMENVHAFDIIAANGPLRRRGTGRGWLAS